MLTVKVVSDIDKFRSGLTDLGKRQLPFAVRVAVNTVAKGLVEDLKKEAVKVFDRPVPYTLNAFYAKFATSSSDPTARVEIKFTPSNGGQSGEQFLRAEIEGGDRHLKRFEKRFAQSVFSTGIPEPMFPSRQAPLDQFGNFMRGTLGQVLSNLRSFPDTGQNVSARSLRRLDRQKRTVMTSAGRSAYFVGKSKNDGMALAIYRVASKGKVEPVLVFARRMPTYKVRFHFGDVVAAGASARFNAALSVAFAAAIASAKPTPLSVKQAFVRNRR